MGNLEGHVLPGTVFLIFALWWTWAGLHRYFLCQINCLYRNKKQAKGATPQYKNLASFPCMINSRKIHFEAYFKIFATTVGIIGELATAFRDGKFVNIGNSQHISMYFFFLLNGIFDVLQSQGWILFPDMDYATSMLAVLIEAFLFWNHLGGRPPMDIQIHTFLLCVLVGILISGLFEVLNRNSVMPFLSRTFLFLLQGTWFYQIGFILYPLGGGESHWDLEGHESMMIATTLFTVHCAAIFIFMTVSAVIIKHRVKSIYTSGNGDKLSTYVLLTGIRTPSGKIFTKELDNEFVLSSEDNNTDEEEVL